MAIAIDDLAKPAVTDSAVRNRGGRTARWMALSLVILVAFVAGFAVAAPDAVATTVSRTGDDLTRILRLMAVLKAMLAAVLAAAIMWRFASPVSFGRLVAYLAAAATMVAGIGLMWDLVHLVAGVSMLHIGLAACAVLLWRDPGVTQRLAERLRARGRHVPYVGSHHQ